MEFEKGIAINATLDISAPIRKNGFLRPNFGDHVPSLIKKGIEVVGVSPDDEKSHLKFIAKQALPFRLIADTDKTLCEKFGVWAEKSMYGKKYMGVLRTTFLIDENGVLVKIINKPKVKEHAKEIAAEFGLG